jgi:hypothetical protein
MTPKKQPDDDAGWNFPGANEEGSVDRPDPQGGSTSVPDPDAPLFPTPTMKVVTGSGGRPQDWTIKPGGKKR